MFSIFLFSTMPDYAFYLLECGVCLLVECLVRMLLAVCGFVGVVVSEKAASVSSVYCFQFAFL